MCACNPSAVTHHQRIAAALSALIALIALGPIGHLARAAAGDPVIVDVRQGTDLGITLDPSGETLVIDLLGGLWRMPSTGGAATPLVATDERAKHPQFSPDGRWIAYQRLIDGQWDIWVLDLIAGERWAVTSTPGNELEPTFLDDGETLVFAGDRDGQYDLWIVSARGGDWRLLAGGRGDARYPAVSERGDVVYVDHSGDTWSLRLQSDGTVRELVTSTWPLATPSWRPGGGVIVYHETDQDAISRLRMLILSEDRVLRSLTDAEDVFATRLAWLTPNAFLYTGDGQIWRRELAARTRRPVHLFAALSVEPAAPAAIRLDTTAPQPLTAHGIAGLSQSRDGQTVAFAALGDIWRIANGELQALTQDVHWDTDPIVSADGTFVVFASDRAGGLQLFRSFAPGAEPEQLTSGSSLAFKPSLDATGTRLAYLSTTALDPNAAAMLNVRYLDDGTEIRTRDAELARADRPEWIDSPDASLAVAAATSGRRERLLFDASLRPVDRGPAGATPPGALPSTALPEWQPATHNDSRYVIQAGRVFTAIGGGYQRHVDIHIEGERIVAVVGRDVLPLPARVIDATELTIVPGLIDVHMHGPTLAGESLGRTLLAHGVTTVRAVADDVDATIARAETWAAGRQLGPRLIVRPRGSAPLVAPPPSYPIVISAASSIADDPSDGSAASPEIGLVRRLSPLRNAYQDVFAILAAAARTEVTALGVLADPAADAHALRARQAMLLRLIRSGTRVAIGSEAPAVPLGAGTQAELELLVSGGVATDQALRIATVGGAIALGLDQDLGTIEAGKIADLVVLSGDPLARIADIERIEAVVATGVWHDRARLLASTR